MYKKLLLLVIIFTVAIIALTYIKGFILYHPIVATPEKYERFYQKMRYLVESKDYLQNFGVRTTDGILLDTIYIKNPDSAKCIIFFHGNTGNISNRFDMIKHLYNYASVIIFDYRSYGKSTSNSYNLSSTDLHTDAQCVWDFAKTNLKINPNDISLFGESLGCSVAIYLAFKLSTSMNAAYYPHSLILNSPFSSLSSMIEVSLDKIKIGFIGKILSVFIGGEYKSDEWIKYINHQTKIIIAHSPRDEIIPYSEGTKLYNCAANIHPHTTFINITGTHNSLGLNDNYFYALSSLFDP